MSYFMGSESSIVDDLSSGNQSAVFECGSNGQDSYDPSIIVSDDQGWEDWTNYTWDTNPSNGFDSGQVGVSFIGQSSGYESATAGGATAAYYGDSFGSITGVSIEAAVRMPAEADWSNITVNFYTGSTLRQTETIGTGPCVDTRSNSSTWTQSQTLLVTTNLSGINRVEVAGSVHMGAAANASLTSDLIFCEVAVVGS